MSQQHLDNIRGFLGTLKNDEFFQMNMKDKKAQMALLHWTNVKRLPANKADRIKEDPSSMYIFPRFIQLKKLCDIAGLSGIPINSVLNGTTDIPGTLLPSPQEKNKKEQESAKGITNGKKMTDTATQEKENSPSIEDLTTKELEEKEAREKRTNLLKRIVFNLILCLIALFIADYL